MTKINDSHFMQAPAIEENRSVAGVIRLSTVGRRQAFCVGLRTDCRPYFKVCRGEIGVRE